MWAHCGFGLEPAQPSEDAATCVACNSKWVRFEYAAESYWSDFSPRDEDDYVIVRRVCCWECGHHRQQVWSPDGGAWIEDGQRSDLPVQVRTA